MDPKNAQKILGGGQARGCGSAVKKKKINFTKHEKLPGVLVIGELDGYPAACSKPAKTTIINSSPAVMEAKQISTISPI